MIYLHGSDERQHQIADNLSKLATEELKRAASARSGQASTKAIGHATGTESEASLLKIIRRRRETGPDLPVDTSAPSATRTRDLLLGDRSARLRPVAAQLKISSMVRAWP